MIIDRRKKGCPNENCEMHKKKKMQTLENDYCPKCGTKLVYVCMKCFKQIEDNGPKHRICSLCDAKEEEKKQKMINGIKYVGGAAVGLGGTIGAFALSQTKDIALKGWSKGF